MKIAILGAGNMARAIIGAAAKSGRMPMDVFCAFDKFREQLDKIKLYGISVTDKLEEACDNADFILFAIKPQDLDGLVTELREACPSYSKKKYITICAGISTSYIENLLGCSVPVIRVMPNTPMMVGAGATAITRNELVTDKDYSKICGIFSFGGAVSSIPEENMNAIISVNSSSPAYFYEFIRVMIEYAVQNGIDEKIARTMAQNAMLGAAKMLISNPDKTPEELIAMVKSKKGTTEAALLSFEQSNYSEMIMKAMDACTKRACELGK